MPDSKLSVLPSGAAITDADLFYSDQSATSVKQAASAISTYLASKLGAGLSLGLTAGSVLFVGAGGGLAQDNAKLFWDDSAFVLKAGTRLQQIVNGSFVNALFPVYNVSGDNWFVGEAGNLTATGAQNMGMGAFCLTLLAGGNNNVGVGYGALGAVTSANQNMGIGSFALSSASSGGSNVGVGQSTLTGITTESGNVAVGSQALQHIAGQINVAIGFGAGITSTSGQFNTYVGPFAGFNITSGSNSTLLGGWLGPAGPISNIIALSDGAGTLKLDYNYSASSVWTFPSTGINMLVNAVSVHALYPIYSASGDNWFIGEAGNTTLTGNNNIGIGAGALASASANVRNIAIGTQALQNQALGGSGSVAIGYQALLLANDATGGNFAFGSFALSALVTGHSNFGIGTNALSSINASSNNFGIGINALLNMTVGSGNVAIGPFAGDLITSGSNNTLIGGWEGPAGALSSAIALSDGAGNLRLDYGYTSIGVWTIPDNVTHFQMLGSTTANLALINGGGNNPAIALNNSGPTYNVYLGSTSVGGVKSIFTLGRATSMYGAGRTNQLFLTLETGVLGFGNFDNTAPGLINSSTKLVAVLADNSANADFQAHTTQTDTTVVGSLPAAGTKGRRFFVTDATQTLTAGIGAVVAGSGANNVPVIDDGTNWRIG